VKDLLKIHPSLQAMMNKLDMETQVTMICSLE